MNCSLSRLLPRQIFLSLCIIAMVLTAVGCAISDYRGYLNHATAAANGEDDDDDGDSNGGIRWRSDVGESKPFGSEIAFITGDPELDGTYSYTFKYDFRGQTAPITGNTPYPSPIDITTYRNRVVGAFNGDGLVDRDGDDIRCNPGDLSLNHDPADPAGIWERRYLYRDTMLDCQFAANFEAAFRKDCDGDDDSDGDTDDGDTDGDNGDDEVPDPSILLCINAPEEEIDNKDLSLQCDSNDPNPATPACNGDDDDEGDNDDGGLAEAFASLGDLATKIWNGAVGKQFTVELTDVQVNGTNYKLSKPLVVTVKRSGTSPVNAKINLTTEGGQSLVKALLNGSKDGVPATVSGTFAGGMQVGAKQNTKVVFNHDSLWDLVN